MIWSRKFSEQARTCTSTSPGPACGSGASRKAMSSSDDAPARITHCRMLITSPFILWESVAQECADLISNTNGFHMVECPIKGT
jgi:hypothetical protein